MSDRLVSEDADDDGLDGSINGLGLAADDAGFDADSCATFVDPWSGRGRAELDDACASDNSESGFAKKWLSGLPKGLSHSLPDPSPGLGSAWTGLDTGDGSSGIDGSGCETSVHPLAGLDPGLGGSRFTKFIQ